VSDDAEIRNLIARIAQTADSGTVEEYLACFTDDAEWAMPANPALGLAASSRQGHDAIREGVVERRTAGVQGPGSSSRHVITTTAITVTADTATARSYWQYWNDTATAPKVNSMGQYDDEFRRTGQGWQLSRRSIVLG